MDNSPEFKFCCSGFFGMIFIMTLTLVLRAIIPNTHQIDREILSELIAFPANPTTDPLLMGLVLFLMIGLLVVFSVYKGLRK